MRSLLLTPSGSHYPYLRRPVGFLLLVAIVAACAPDSAEGIYGPWVGEQEQRGDTLVVRTVAGSVRGDTMVLVPELAIGEMEGEEAFLFGGLQALQVDSAGRIYVLDRQAKEVRIFSSEGEHLLSFGREGAGPGEFRNPNHMRLLADGRIVVRDAAPGRFSVFSSEGTYLGGWLLQSSFSTSTPFVVDLQNRILDPTIRNPGVAPPEWQHALVRFEPDGTVVDTIDVPTTGIRPPRLEVKAGGGGMATYSIPFTTSEHWTFTHDGGPIFGVSDAYRIDLPAADGTILRVERALDPVTVPAAEAAAAREDITRRIRSANDPNWRWNGPDIPIEKPVFTGLLAGVDGTLWVFVSTPSVEVPNPEWDPELPEHGRPTRWTSPVVADVFGEGGRYLGPVKMPAEVSLHVQPVLSRDVVWAAAMHPMGYPQVVRYRILPAADAAQGVSQ